MADAPKKRSETDGKPQPVLTRLDEVMAQNAWHPRLAPFGMYIVMLVVVQSATEHLDPRIYPFVYTLQCALVVWLLWRYRKLTPELTVRFHWLAVPVGVGVLVAWILLGWTMAGEFSQRWTALVQEGRWLGRIEYPRDGAPYFATTEVHFLATMRDESPGFYWASNILRLLGMSIVVPLFEELFVRSLILRSMSRRRQTGIGLLQVLTDMPLIGDWLTSTKRGQEAAEHPPVFGAEFDVNKLGVLTGFGVFASTLVFTLSHGMRDWPGCVVCGVAYCVLLAATRHKGLGPVAWAHGITNALLWWYTLGTEDWQFL